nr:M56 family metallopeptidase [Agromyces seonyuensis]
MLGSLLAFALHTAGGVIGLPDLIPELWHGPIPAEFGVLQITALAAAVLLGAHLLANLALTAVRTERERRRQHRLIALLADPLPGEPRTSVLAHAAPLAYCVPGVRTATVVTDGLVTLLERDELDAVVAHERAHLAGFHHLIQLAFRAWHTSLPWFPVANRAERAVTMLTEELADNAAVRATSRGAVHRALTRVGADGELAALADAGGVSLDDRMQQRRLVRLEAPPAELPTLARVAVLAAAALLVATPVALVLSSL